VLRQDGDDEILLHFSDYIIIQNVYRACRNKLYSVSNLQNADKSKCGRWQDSQRFLRDTYT
jgi:hypothetical protein